MMELTGTSFHSSSQHVELNQSRKQIDFNDCETFYLWLTTHNPFQVQDKNLYSLSSGLVSIVGKDLVNCEKAEEVGSMIQKSFDNTPFKKCTVRTKDLIKPLAVLNNPKREKEVLVDSISIATLCRFVPFLSNGRPL